MVTPEQFLGIEIKPWAKEITELVLWIGWLQWQIRTRGWKTSPQEPILRDYHNIECRDAVLAYDTVEPLLDDDGTPVTRWDGETMKISPVTGEEIPDETARTPVYHYVNPRKAEWPEADYIVGNPPFIGNKRMISALGEGYVDALRGAHPDVSESADFVVYWWYHGLHALTGTSKRVGLVSTNSLGQPFNRKVFDGAWGKTARPRFVIPDHPWVDSTDGAAVRISMVVLTATPGRSVLARVSSEAKTDTDTPLVELMETTAEIHADLTGGVDIREAARRKLEANQDIAFMGVTSAGDGFRIDAESLSKRGIDVRKDSHAHARPFLIGRDLLRKPEEKYIIDFFPLSEDEALASEPQLFQWLIDRVKPERSQNRRKAYREKWWLFAEPRKSLREALHGLERYIATVRVSKYKLFQFVSADTVPDSGIIAITLDDGYFLGILSSRIHLTWALRVSSTLEDRPYWNVSVAFEPFPFPASNESTKERVRSLAEALDRHRKQQPRLHPELTITGMYNVLEKLRSGEELTEKDKDIHEKGLVSVLLAREVTTASFRFRHDGSPLRVFCTEFDLSCSS